jgi:hypothetical protein
LLPELGREEPMTQVCDLKALTLDAGSPAGVQVVGDGLVLLEGLLPAVALDAHELAVDARGSLAGQKRGRESI